MSYNNCIKPNGLNSEEVVTVNGFTGVLKNRDEINRFKETSRIPLSEYPINQDPNPLIIRKQCPGDHRSTQDISVRFLQPPPLPQPGEIIIKEEVRIKNQFSRCFTHLKWSLWSFYLWWWLNSRRVLCHQLRQLKFNCRRRVHRVRNRKNGAKSRQSDRHKFRARLSQCPDQRHHRHRAK